METCSIWTKEKIGPLRWVVQWLRRLVGCPCAGCTVQRMRLSEAAQDRPDEQRRMDKK